MLTKTEFSNIQGKTANAFLHEAYHLYQNEISNRVCNGIASVEVFLYTYALGKHEFGGSDNILTDNEIREIYSRIREISNA